MFVDDVAQLALESASAEGNVSLDAVGPETFTFKELVALVRRMTGGRSLLVNLPPALVFAAAQLMSVPLRDVVLTRDEISGLMAGHLVSDNPPTGVTRLTAWLQENRHTLGRHYASELARHYR